MGVKTKRTYNLSEETVARVRDLAGHVGAASSQDAVVELAVERLYREVRDQQDASQWARASGDPEFRAEVKAIASEYGDPETWPR